MNIQEEKMIQGLKKLSWMQWGSFIGVVITAFAWVHTDMKVIESRLDAQLIANRQEISTQAQRSDQLYSELNAAISAQAARSDQLYNMFYDLLKEKKQ